MSRYGQASHRDKKAGVSRLIGETLATNVRMLGLARKTGFTITPSAKIAGQMQLEKLLPVAPAAVACGDVASEIRAAA